MNCSAMDGPDAAAAADHGGAELAPLRGAVHKLPRRELHGLRREAIRLSTVRLENLMHHKQTQ